MTVKAAPRVASRLQDGSPSPSPSPSPHRNDSSDGASQQQRKNDERATAGYWGGGLRLGDRAVAPAYSKDDYPHIQRAFIMPGFRLPAALWTFVAPNNESANVYSQLAGLLVFAWMFITVYTSAAIDLMDGAALQLAPSPSPSPSDGCADHRGGALTQQQEAEHRKGYYLLALGSVVACCCSSLVTHLFQARSSRWHSVLAVCDWSGTLVICIATCVACDSVDLSGLIRHHLGSDAPWLAGLLLATTGEAHLHVVVFVLAVTLGIMTFMRTSHVTRFVLIFAVVFWMRSHFTPDVDVSTLMIPTIIQGAAMAMFFIPLTSIILSGQPPDKIPAAAGLSNFVRIMFGGMGTSITSTLWDKRTALHHAQLAEHSGTDNPAFGQAVQALQSQGLSEPGALAVLERGLSVQASTLGATDIFWLSAILFIALIGLVWMTKPRKTAASADAMGAH